MMGTARPSEKGQLSLATPEIVPTRYFSPSLRLYLGIFAYSSASYSSISTLKYLSTVDFSAFACSGSNINRIVDSLPLSFDR